MKPLLLIMIMGMAPAALGETIGSAGQGSFMFGVPEQAASAAVETAPVQQVRAVPVPLPPERPANLQSHQASQTSDVPFQATLGGSDPRCPDPIAHPNARNTPVKVYIDQHTQTVEIYTPDRAEPWVSKVSTGGGLKIPNGQYKKPPYCARTPSKDRHIISAVREEMFQGTGCTKDEIRAKSTVFPMYHTRTFTDKNGNPIPMPKAVRITGGIFFHEVPPSYKDMLGHNVSGECVRMTPKTAEFLQQQIEKYGAIEVSISEPPQVAREMPQYCDEYTLARARGDVQSEHRTVAVQHTGTEDVYGGRESFFSVLGRVLNGGRQPRRQQQQRRQVRQPVDYHSLPGGLY